MVECDRSFRTNEDGWNNARQYFGSKEEAADFGTTEGMPNVVENEEEPEASSKDGSFLRLAGALTALTDTIDRMMDWMLRTSFKVFILFLLIMIALYLFTKINPGQPSASARTDLREFVHATELSLAATNSSSFQDLPTESFKTYAASYCIEQRTLDAARDSLSDGLVSLPVSVRDKIVNAALREGLTAMNTWEDSEADLTNSLQAHSYMAFYSTIYKEDEDKYQTCVSAAGNTFVVAETIAGYTETEEEYLVGYKHDCTGVFFSCWKVPYYGKRIVRVPQFKRNTLSLKQQEGLHNWMVRQAIESAGRLVGSSGDEGRLLPEGPSQAQGWSYSMPELVDEL